MSWTVVIPYYNERAFLPATLASLLAQTRRPARLVLVDNASTDGSEEAARAALEGATELKVDYLREERPGKINALRAARDHLKTEFVALCDADTHYPPHYLARGETLMRGGGGRIVAAMAVGVMGDAASLRSRLYRAKTLAVSKLLGKQAHTGGFGQMFRTDAYLESGGYDAEIWPYMMADHEILQRILKRGRAAYAYDLWCRTSDRRSNASAVYWTLAERLLYHVTPFAKKDWYFYDYLGPRMKQRKMENAKLRERTWESGDGAPRAEGRPSESGGAAE